MDLRDAGGGDDSVPVIEKLARRIFGWNGVDRWADRYEFEDIAGLMDRSRAAPRDPR